MPTGGITSGFPRHNLERLVRQYGGEEAAGEAIEAAVYAALDSGRLVVDRRRQYKQALDVGGHLVTVSGRVIDGVVHIGSAWIPP